MAELTCIGTTAKDECWALVHRYRYGRIFITSAELVVICAAVGEVEAGGVAVAGPGSVQRVVAQYPLGHAPRQAGWLVTSR